MNNGQFAAGFSEPVLDAQSVFRVVLDALANPAKGHALTPRAGAVDALSAGLAAVLLTLTDHDTPLWLSPRLDSKPVREFIAFHTGAPIAQRQDKAMFALVAEADEMPALDLFNSGLADYPDRSTTIVRAVPALDGGKLLSARGPGIDGSLTLAPRGLPDDFVDQWSVNRALFPRGVDLLLVTDSALMGLPRTSRIVEA